MHTCLKGDANFLISLIQLMVPFMCIIPCLDFQEVAFTFPSYIIFLFLGSTYIIFISLSSRRTFLYVSFVTRKCFLFGKEVGRNHFDCLDGGLCCWNKSQFKNLRLYMTNWTFLFMCCSPSLELVPYSFHCFNPCLGVNFLINSIPKCVPLLVFN